MNVKKKIKLMIKLKKKKDNIKQVKPLYLDK